MDLKNVLQDNSKQDLQSESNINIHKKPIQLRDIENRSSSKTRVDSFESKEQITQLLNKEKNNIFKQSWNKLDKGMKLNRIKEFIQREVKEKNLNKIQELQISQLLFQACSNNKLNRVNDVIYNKEKGFIEQFKNLSSNDNIYTLKLNEPKQQRSSGKPKSNIDRFLKSAK